MKTRLFSILCILMMSLGIQAHDLEPLHVDGRYLKNPNGDIVTLHGFITLLDGWFQVLEYNHGYDTYNVTEVLENKKAVIDRLLTSGWKMDYVRFSLDGYWCCDNENWQEKYVDRYESFRFDLFKKYFEELYLPLIDYYHEKGIYTVLVPPCGPPLLIEGGDEFQQHMLLIWDYVSNHPRIRNNPGVMFELVNEPIFIKCKQGENYESFNDELEPHRRIVFKEVRDYWQPVVDKIRSHCDNIIYIPGMLYESNHAGFADYPLKGGNIGYAVHWYPGWWGTWSGNLRKDWENHVFPIAYKAPIIITETMWGSAYGGGTGWGGITSDFGEPLKRIIDELGNVSWNGLEQREDYYYLVNNTSSNENNVQEANDPDCFFLPAYHWWNEYAETKVLPTSQLKAKNVLFDNFPTSLKPGQKVLAGIKAEFTNGMTWDVSGDAEYIIGDESVLSIEQGVIWALKEGKTNVIVKYTDGTEQVFNREFEVTNTLFPLTKEGFVLDWFSLDAGGSFDETTGTFSSGGPGSGGWDFEGGMDFSSYKYLVVQLNHEQHCSATLHIYGDRNLSDENSAWNDEIGGVGFPFNNATELVIDLHSLHKQNGDPLDLSHIYHIDVWINGAEGSVSIKRVFFSNDGSMAAYQDPTCVYADNKVMYYGDEVPVLTYSISGPRIDGTPILSITANSASSAGSYPITIKRGSVTNEQATFIDGEFFVFKAPLTVGVQDMTITVGDAIPMFNLTYSGFRNSDTEDNAFTTKPTATTSATASSKPGIYPITVSGGEATNYALTYTQGTLTIKEKDVMLGDLNDDRSVSITDVVLIIDVIAGSITDENKVKAADVNKDGNVTITDCVAAIDLIAAQSKAVRMNRASALPVSTDYISASMKDNLLTVSLENENRYIAFQMVVTMPEGMTIGKAAIDNQRGTDHQLVVHNLGNGQYLVAGYSMDNNELAGNSGQLLNIITNGYANGDIVISDIEFATAEAEAYHMAPVSISSTATGIYQIENREWKQDDVIFDLQGRRVNQPSRGLYIVNGSKLIVK